MSTLMTMSLTGSWGAPLTQTKLESQTSLLLNCQLVQEIESDGSGHIARISQRLETHPAEKEA